MALKKATSITPPVKRALLERERPRRSEATWTPNTDVYITDVGLVIKAELAGMRKEDLELLVDGNHLRISGVRRDGCRVASCRFVVMEINYGTFESVVEVPPGYDITRAKASYQNGFLRVDVPHVARHSDAPFAVPIESDMD